MAADDLEGGLIGLGTGIGEEGLGPPRTRRGEDQLDDLLGQTDLSRRGENVRDVAQCRDLLADRRHDRGMSVPQTIDGDSREQVDVLATVGVP